MSDLTPKARALLARAARAHEPTEDDRARIRARVARKIALGACAAGAASATSKTLTAGTGGFLTKAVVSVAIVGTVGVGATHWVASHSDPSTCKIVSVVSAPASVAPIARGVSKPGPAAVMHEEPAEVHEVPSPAPPPSTVIARKHPVPKASAIEPAVPAPSAERVDPLAMVDEVDVLARAHEALARGDGPLALALVEEHGRRFPKSALAEERAAVHVFALCASGRGADAAREGAQFLEKHPRSPLAERVRGSCPGMWGAPPPHPPEKGGNL
ncbi:hypothetical protein LZC95_53065 [Pendulispora brunnea]|uniref:Uncharacterized protein n=1 Tax=Pendulispora brunnea TaxID=2905690 RepID=A0ABZ2K911_9BACT